MSAWQLVAQAGDSGVGTSTPEAVVFWLLAPVSIVAAVRLVFARNTVHAALWLVVDLLCLAVFFAVQEAPFLALVQVIVYTGAIIMLFLFVLMLIGLDRNDSLVETLRGQRVATVLLSLAFAGLLGAGLVRVLLDQPAAGLEAANDPTNVVGIAQLLFTDYVFAFELTSALLIVAAVGAMVLAHRDRPSRLTQRQLVEQRFGGRRPSPLPGPGVYAEPSHRTDTAALLPSGEEVVDDAGGSTGGAS